jgi:hypothetical protein
MKIRIGFVTNSSSTSYITLSIRVVDKDGAQKTFEFKDDSDRTYVSFEDIEKEKQRLVDLGYTCLGFYIDAEASYEG